MTDWTAERLDALPEWTVITWTENEGDEVASGHRKPGRWTVHYYGDDTIYSEGIIAEADPGSIRIISVPIDALVSAGTVSSARDYLHSIGRWVTKQDAATIIRAAIAHMIGGEEHEVL